MSPRRLALGLLVSVVLIPKLPVCRAGKQDVASWLQAIQSVAHRGAGHVEAQRALRKLQATGPDALIPFLKALDDAKPLAANWLANAFEVIADRQRRQGRALPADQLEAFVVDTRHAARARRLAFEWLLREDSTASDRLIPQMLNDPGAEFRRDAVARLIQTSRQLLADRNSDRASAVLHRALTGATDDDQVKAIVASLKKLGEQIDLQTHFGFIVEWQILGPFDNTGQQGFDVAYPPESQLDLEGEYDGKLGQVRWASIATDSDYGIIDIAKSIAPYKGAVMYLTNSFTSERQQDVEFRIGTPNAWKLWLNGKLLFAREEYHRGMFLDQYRVPVTLKRGENRILIKLCQNEQTEDWAQKYQIQFRVCDPGGRAVLPLASAR